MTTHQGQQLLVLLGIALNAGALAYAFYVRSLVYAVVFGGALGYLLYTYYAPVEERNGPEPE